MPVAARSGIVPRLALPLLALSSLACTGSLVDLDAQDMASQKPPATTFASAIQGDLDTLGCSAGGSCHGGSMGTAMHVTAGVTDLPSLMANYGEVKPRASSGASSLLLTKPLATSGVSHGGSRPFASTSDPTYQKWLAWIQAGAPFASGGADAGTPVDASVPVDASGSD